MHVNPNPAKLFIGNLSFKTSRQEVMDYFAQAGKVVDATILTDKFTGRSRGFGFVEMSTPEEAQKAKEMLNGKEFMERPLIVNDARPEQPRDNMPQGEDSSSEAPLSEGKDVPQEKPEE